VRKRLDEVYAAYGEADADFDALAAEQAKLEAIVFASDGEDLDRQLEIAATRCGYRPGMQRSARSPAVKSAASRSAVCCSPTDMLLLDEPTNHLDAESVEWLEQFLQRFRAPSLR